jgi:hypothetical protein
LVQQYNKKIKIKIKTLLTNPTYLPTYLFLSTLYVMGGSGGKGVLNHESVVSRLFTIAERDVAAEKKRERERERERVLCVVFWC